MSSKCALCLRFFILGDKKVVTEAGKSAHERCLTAAAPNPATAVKVQAPVSAAVPAPVQFLLEPLLKFQFPIQPQSLFQSLFLREYHRRHRFSLHVVLFLQQQPKSHLETSTMATAQQDPPAGNRIDSIFDGKKDVIVAAEFYLLLMAQSTVTLGQQSLSCLCNHESGIYI